MNKSIFIPTIKFGGGEFIANNILCDVEQSPLKTPTPGTVTWDNVYRGKLVRMYRLAQKAITIIPIVHPRTIAYHWMKSGQDIDPDFYRMWQDIWSFEGRDGVEPFYFVLDDPETREARLEELSELLQIPLVIDWNDLNMIEHDMVSDMHLLEEADRVRETEKLHAKNLDRFYGDAPAPEPEVDSGEPDDSDSEPEPELETETAAPKAPAKKKTPAKRKHA